MDQFGKVFREFARQAHTKQVRTALSLAEEFVQERMSLDQIEEMLYSAGFEARIVDEAMELLPKRSKK